MKKILIALVLTTICTSVGFAQKGNAWIKKNHEVSGKWSIKTIGERSFIILHSDFKTAEGSDLKLFITKKSATAVENSEAIEKHGVLLGTLASNKGEQKFQIPDNLNISDYKSLVIHSNKNKTVWAATTLKLTSEK